MIFGSGSAKFTGVAGVPAVVTLENSIIRPEWCNRNYSVNQAISDHYSTFKFHGDYSEFWVDLNLYQYTAPDDPTDKFAEIYPYLYTDVYFWPHVDGKAISGSNGIPTKFFIDEMKHSYLSDDFTTKDVLSIHFKSVNYTVISGSI